MLTQAIPSPSHGRSPEVSAMAANCWLMLLCNFLPDLIPTHVPPFVLPCLTLLCPCPTLCPIVSNLVLPKSNLVSYCAQPCPTQVQPCVLPCPTHVKLLVLPCKVLPMSNLLSHLIPPTSNPLSYHVRPGPTLFYPCPTVSCHAQPMVRTCPSSSYPCPTSGPTCVGPFPTVSDIDLPVSNLLSYPHVEPCPTLSSLASDLILPISNPLPYRIRPCPTLPYQFPPYFLT